jgi:hypothetical protein
MGAKYHKSDGKMTVEITSGQLKIYFSEDEEDESTKGTQERLYTKSNDRTKQTWHLNNT